MGARRVAGRQASRSWETPQCAATADAALRNAVRANPANQQAWREANGGSAQNPGAYPAPGGGYAQLGYAQPSGAGVIGFAGGPVGFGGPASGFASAAAQASRSASRSSSGGNYGGLPSSREGSDNLPNEVGRSGSGFSAGRSGSGFSRGSGAVALLLVFVCWILHVIEVSTAALFSADVNCSCCEWGLFLAKK